MTRALSKTQPQQQLNALENVLAWCSGNIPLFTARSHRLFYNLTLKRVGSRLPGYQILWLTTVGRKSGKPRTWPLIYFQDGDNLVVLASNNGAHVHPQWYLNLLANPIVTVEVDGKPHQVRAVAATPQERARLWHVALQKFPPYTVVVKRTRREIPLVLLQPL